MKNKNENTKYQIQLCAGYGYDVRCYVLPGMYYLVLLTYWLQLQLH